MSISVRTAGAAALMAAWTGGATLFAAVMAPAAFDALSREQAGDVVGRVLPVVFISGIVVAVACWIIAHPRDWWRRTAVLIAGVACGIAEFGIGPRIAAIRDAMGGALSTLSPDDPQRILFGRLHAISVAWLGAAMIAAFVFVLLSLRALRPRAQEQS